MKIIKTALIVIATIIAVKLLVLLAIGIWASNLTHAAY